MTKVKKIKAKTHKGLKHRVRLTRNGKVMRKRPGRRHLATSKSGNRRRHLGRDAEVGQMFARMVTRLLQPVS